MGFLSRSLSTRLIVIPYGRFDRPLTFKSKTKFANSVAGYDSKAHRHNSL
jgi:hypothetical protein